MFSERHPAARPARATGPRGLSIIEVMVGLVVALLIGLAAANSAMLFTAQQRQGIGTGGSAINAGAVMASLRDDLSAAGLGFFGDSAYLCNKLNFSFGATTVSDGADFVPLQVVRGTAGDTIDVIWGTQVESGVNVRLRAASTGTSAALNSYLPVAVNDAVLLAPAAPSPTIPCLLRTVTGVTASTDTTPQTLDFASTGWHNQVNFTTNPSFTDTARMTQLGRLNWARYRVTGGNLVLERPLTGASAIIARNVISFRMQYGVSAATPGSTALESWVDPTAASGFATLSSVNLPRVRALRVGLIVRSPQPEKPDDSGNCTATETRPSLWGAAHENLTNADWNCFRYRTSTVVVPLRNIVLGLMTP